MPAGPPAVARQEVAVTRGQAGRGRLRPKPCLFGAARGRDPACAAVRTHRADEYCVRTDGGRPEAAVQLVQQRVSALVQQLLGQHAAKDLHGNGVRCVPAVWARTAMRGGLTANLRQQPHKGLAGRLHSRGCCSSMQTTLTSRWLGATARKDGKPGSPASRRAAQRRCGCWPTKSGGGVQWRLPSGSSSGQAK